jgi:hypothetical protein
MAPLQVTRLWNNLQFLCCDHNLACNRGRNDASVSSVFQQDREGNPPLGFAAIRCKAYKSGLRRSTLDLGRSCLNHNLRLNITQTSTRSLGHDGPHESCQHLRLLMGQDRLGVLAFVGWCRLLPNVRRACFHDWQQWPPLLPFERALRQLAPGHRLPAAEPYAVVWEYWVRPLESEQIGRAIEGFGALTQGKAATTVFRQNNLKAPCPL